MGLGFRVRVDMIRDGFVFLRGRTEVERAQKQFQKIPAGLLEKQKKKQSTVYYRTNSGVCPVAHNRGTAFNVPSEALETVSFR